MKKFLLVLLIAVAATATVQIETSELNNWFTDWLKKIGQFFKALGGKLANKGGKLPVLSGYLKAKPIPYPHMFMLALFAMTILIVMEIYKLIRYSKKRKSIN